MHPKKTFIGKIDKGFDKQRYSISVLLVDQSKGGRLVGVNSNIPIFPLLTTILTRVPARIIHADDVIPSEPCRIHNKSSDTRPAQLILERSISTGIDEDRNISHHYITYLIIIGLHHKRRFILVDCYAH